MGLAGSLPEAFRNRRWLSPVLEDEWACQVSLGLGQVRGCIGRAFQAELIAEVTSRRGSGWRGDRAVSSCSCEGAAISPTLATKTPLLVTGKLEVVKQDMARVNINTLGIRELKWTGMGEFNSDDHYIYYCSQESLRKKME